MVTLCVLVRLPRPVRYPPRSHVVEIAGIVRDPDGGWMKQVARNLLDAEDGFVLGQRFLIIIGIPFSQTTSERC